MKFNKAMKASVLGIGLALVCNLAMATESHEAAASEDMANTMGMYTPAQKDMVVPAFVNSVNNWLHKYRPKLISRDAHGARMQVDYKNMFEVELTVKDREYEITARPVGTVTKEARAERIAYKLVSGIQKYMSKQLR